MLPDLRPSNPLAAIYRRLEAVERVLRESASTSRTLESATVGSGGIDVKGEGGIDVGGGGNVRILDGGWMVIEDGGEVRIVNGDDQFVMRISGDGQLSLVNRETNRGISMFGASMYFYPDVFTTEGRSRLSTYDDGSFFMGTPQGTTWFTGGDLRLYELPESTQAGNLRLQVDEGGIPRIYYGSASNEDLKPGLKPLDVPVADVLGVQASEWLEGDDHVVGVTVEQVSTLGSLSPFLVRPRYGGGETIEYDRLPVLQQVVLQDHEARIAELEQTVADQAKAIAALTDRLDALGTAHG